ncbi:MAG: acyl-CoA dehydrogenase family protein [Planctomycetota bacterium]
MDFALDEKLLARQAEARAFARDEVAPGAAERDRKKEYPEKLVRRAAELGYMGCLVPEKMGGSGLGNLGQCVVLEEVAAACAGTHVTLSVHNSLVSAPIYKYGGPEVHERWLGAVGSGEKLGCYLLTEPGSGSDAAAMSTTATEDGDYFVINGDKMWITTGDVAQVGVVFAITNLDRSVRNTKAISAFVIDFDDPGVTFGKREPKLGLRASTTVAVFLKDVRVHKSQMLGERDRGFSIAMDMLNGGRIGIAVQAIGIARAALELALERSEISKRNGKPLGKSQLARFRMAEIATSIEASRLLAWRAALLRDRKENHIREASMAKLMATQSANDACRRVVELLGEAGYSDDCAAERLMRDCRVTELYEGTTEVQKLVISRQLL